MAEDKGQLGSVLADVLVSLFLVSLFPGINTRGVYFTSS